MTGLFKAVPVVSFGLLIGCQPSDRPVAAVEPEGRVIDVKSLEEYLLRQPDHEPLEQDIPYPARIFKPDTRIDHKIVVLPPDPNVDFKINIIPPDSRHPIPPPAPHRDP